MISAASEKPTEQHQHESRYKKRESNGGCSRTDAAVSGGEEDEYTPQHIYLFPEVDGNIGDRQRHQEADEGPVRAERWSLHHSRSRGEGARGICLGLDGLTGKLGGFSGWRERERERERGGEGAPVLFSIPGGEVRGRGWRNRGRAAAAASSAAAAAPEAAARRTASMLPSGGEGQRENSHGRIFPANHHGGGGRERHGGGGEEASRAGAAGGQ